MPELICASCGAAVPANAKFCLTCGAKAPVAPVGAPLPSAQQQQFQAPQPTAQPPLPQCSAAPASQAVPVVAPVPIASPAPDEKPMNTMGYLLMLLVFSVPLAGVAAAFLWAFGKKTAKARKNLALARLIVWGIFFIAALVFYILNFRALNELVKVIFS